MSPEKRGPYDSSTRGQHSMPTMKKMEKSSSNASQRLLYLEYVDILVSEKGQGNFDDYTNKYEAATSFLRGN
jgi:hypothetical protein